MGNVLFIACTNVGKSMIEAIMSDSSVRSKVCGIVNLNAQRGMTKANYQSYLDLSETYNIPLHLCNNVNDKDTLDWIREKEPDVIIQSGWSQKFKDELLSIPKYICIGEHPAPLPKGRGAACVNWAIINGETEWGDSFFEMVSEYDKGNLLAQSFFDIKEYDNVKTVYDKVAIAAVAIIKKNIDNWTLGIVDGQPQSNEGSSYFKRRTPADGFFTFEKTATELHNFIRAQTFPYPGAFIRFGGRDLRILSSSIVHDETSDKPCGTILFCEDGYIDIVCEKGSVLRIHRVQYDKEPECWAEDFLRVFGINVGERLVSFH